MPQGGHLLGLVLLVVARRHKAVGIDDVVGSGRGTIATGLLHGQEGADALDLALEAAVSQAPPPGRQPARRHPVGILLLLEDERFIYRFRLSD